MFFVSELFIYTVSMNVIKVTLVIHKVNMFSEKWVRLIRGTADRGTCGTCGTAGTCGTYIFCNKILKKIKIVIIKMSTSGLVLKNNRERKKRKIKREKANKKDSVQQGVFFVGHPSKF